MTMAAIARRVFLGGVAASGVVGIAVALREQRLLETLGTEERQPLAAVLRLLTGQRGDGAGVAAAATEALRRHQDRWFDRPSALASIREGTINEVVGLIRDACRDDYRNGRILPVHGWLISRTETEVIALLH
jgi:hypothetical protein